MHKNIFIVIWKKTISNGAKKSFFPNINIKYCAFHYKNPLEKSKNKLYFNEMENNNDVYIYYKYISNFSFYKP